MNKKILLPTDFSKHSWNAIVYATKLFANQKCDFYILNTYAKDSHGLDNVTLLDPDEAFNKLSEKRSKQGLGDILMRLSVLDQRRCHLFHVISRPAHFLDAVTDVVDQLNIDIIIMGAKGMNDRHEGKYGKSTLGVIETVRECPVLVVPGDVIYNHPKEIVLATNFDTDFKTSEVQHLAEIAKISNAKVQVLSLTDSERMTAEQKKNKTRLQHHLQGLDYTFNVLHNVKMASALSCFVEIRNSNMISYIDKKPTLWEQLGFGKPTLGKLGYYNDVPVLALHG